MPPPPSKCDRGSLKERDCSSATNSFSNDGSFLEHFKKRETEFSPAKTPTSSSRSDHETEENDGSRAEQCREESSSMKPTSKPAVKFGQFCGKRKALMKSQPKPKKKKEDEAHSGKSEPWKAYMAEVKRYKDQTCADDSETVRPLVK